MGRGSGAFFRLLPPAARLPPEEERVEVLVPPFRVEVALFFFCVVAIVSSFPENRLTEAGVVIIVQDI